MEKMPADREKRWRSIFRRYGIPEDWDSHESAKTKSPLDALKQELKPPIPPSLNPKKRGKA